MYVIIGKLNKNVIVSVKVACITIIKRVVSGFVDNAVIILGTRISLVYVLALIWLSIYELHRNNVHSVI